MSRIVQIDRISRSLSDAPDRGRTLAWVRPALAVLVLACACATHRETAASLDSKSASNEEVSAKVDTEIHKVEGAAQASGRTLEFAPPTYPGQPLKDRLRKSATNRAKLDPVTTDTHAKADSSAVGARTAILDGRLEQVKDSKPSLGIPALGLVLAGLAAAAVFTRTLWLGPLLNLAKRLLGRG